MTDATHDSGAWLLEEPEAPPERELPVVPALVPPLRDVFFSDGVLVWMRFRVGDWLGVDLGIERCATSSAGDEPEWLRDEESNGGWDVILGKPLTPRPWMTFALQHGIAPGQPFLLWLERPKYYRCSYEYDEYDCDYQWDIVRVMPRTAEQSAAAWASAIARDALAEARNRRRAEAERQRRETDVDAMYLRGFNYGGIDCAWAGNGTGVKLLSRHGHAELAEGRDDKGSLDLAKERLIAVATARLPNLSADVVRGMRVRW